MSEEKLSSQEELIKKYLEEQIEKDEALKSLYVPSKIKDCFSWITEQAKKKANEERLKICVMIEDSQVYKWARDYYLEELPRKATEQEAVVVQEKAQQKAEQQKTTEEKPKYVQGLLFDFGEEK